MQVDHRRQNVTAAGPRRVRVNVAWPAGRRRRGRDNIDRSKARIDAGARRRGGPHVQLDRGGHRRFGYRHRGGAPGRRPRAGRSGATLDIVSAYEPASVDRLRVEQSGACPTRAGRSTPARRSTTPCSRSRAGARGSGVAVERVRAPGRPGRRDPRRRRGARRPTSIVIGNKGLTGRSALPARFGARTRSPITRPARCSSSARGSWRGAIRPRLSSRVAAVRRDSARSARIGRRGRIDEPGAVALAVIGGRRGASPWPVSRLRIAVGRRVRSEHPAGDDERGRGRHVRRGHRGAVVAGRDPELAWVGAEERHLVDVRARTRRRGGSWGRRAGRRRRRRPGPRASGPRPVVGVVGQAAVLRRRADGDRRTAPAPGRRPCGCPRCRPPRPRRRRAGGRSGSPR